HYKRLFFHSSISCIVILLNEFTKIHEVTSFKELCECSFKLLTARNPVLSTQMGLETYSEFWPDISAKGVQQDTKILKAIQTKLKDFLPSLLSKKADREDYSLLEWFLGIALFELEKMRFWAANPRLTGLILSGLNGLILKSHFQEEKRVTSLVYRLKRISKLVEDIKSRVTEPVQLWVNGEINAYKPLTSFVKSIPQAFPYHTHTLSEAVIIALEAIKQYQNWLQSLEGADSLPYNKSYYEELILKRRLGMNAKKIEELGKYYLQKTEEILTELTTNLPGNSVNEVRANIRKKHPTSFEQLLDEHKQLAKKAKQFLQDKDLITFPLNEDHQVIFTPAPIRHLMSLGGASPPGRFDDPQRGYYWITPYDNPKMLEEHPSVAFSIFMAHESYPGHNLHAICANTHPSIVRTHLFAYPSPNLGLMYSSQAAEVIEGWGLYCEEMMLKHGFEDDPTNPNLEKKFILINALRWRAARVILDVQLHTGRITYTKAVEFLQKAIGINKTISEAEVLMYSQSPGYFLSYLIGKHLLVNLKTKLGIPDKIFHDKIVYSGVVPYWFLKEHVFSH
ncbi:MAG: DUF885 family protein, partial [Candidatus Hodarchaeota archaeon]